MALHGSGEFARPSYLVQEEVAPPRSRLFEQWQEQARPGTEGSIGLRSTVQSLHGSRCLAGELTPRAAVTSRPGTETSHLRRGCLTERASSSQRPIGGRLPPESLDYVGAFKDACCRKYRTLMRAWRLDLDQKGVGRVPFSTFCNSARSMGFGNLRKLWTDLDTNQSGFLTLDKWDPQGLDALMKFKAICRREYGDLEHAFLMAMDQTRSATVTPREFAEFCERVGFPGDVQALFALIDVHEFGFFTMEQLDFLVRWQGERYAPPKPASCGVSGKYLSMSLCSTGSTTCSSAKSRTRSVGSTLQAMPELAHAAASRRRRARQRTHRPADDAKPMRWHVATG